MYQTQAPRCGEARCHIPDKARWAHRTLASRIHNPTNKGWSLHEANAKPGNPTCRKDGCDDSKQCGKHFSLVTGRRFEERPTEKTKREPTHSKRPPDHWSSRARPQRESFARCGIGLHGEARYGQRGGCVQGVAAVAWRPRLQYHDATGKLPDMSIDEYIPNAALT